LERVSPKAKTKKPRVRRRAVTTATARRARKSRTAPGITVNCPIVGIGGSAGGFEAAMELLRHLPPKTGMAFVIVQHLDPHHDSGLPKCALTVPPNKIDSAVITLVDLEGRKDSYASKTPRRPKQSSPRK
jgi:chemotaxis response regulator CheB